MGKGDFDTGQDYDNLPDDDYIMQVTKAPLGPTKAGDKDMIAPRWTVIYGDYSGVTIRDWIVLQIGKNGYGKLGRICKAMSIKGVRQDPEGLEPHEQGSVFKHLLGAVCVVTTKQEQRTDKDTGDGVFDDDGDPVMNIRPVSFKAVAKKTMTAIKAQHGGMPPLPEDSNEDWKGNELGDGIPF